ncbi:MAG: imidazolonepropionase-like amidohydrolase [Myxococcota bacterium]|jgi:imidazolonepropionase-like amidohydrolase
MPAHKTPQRGLTRRGMLSLLAAGAVLPRIGRAGLDGRAEGGLSGTFTLSGATLLSHTGTTSTGGVRVEDGVIVALGAAVTGGLDVGGVWLCPGFTDAGCTVGLVEVPMEGSTRDTSESSGMITADARAVDAYNALSDVVPVTRANGITSVLVHPAFNHLITGQAALLRTIGLSAHEAVIRAPAGLCMSLGRGGQSEGGPKSRMGVAMQLRELLDGLPKPPEEEETGRKKRGKKDDGGEDEDDLTPSDRMLRQLRRGEVMALISAERVDDILLALELVETYNLKAALVGCSEGHLIAPQIASAGVGVLLGPTTIQPNSFQHPHAIYENPAILYAAGVTLALRSSSAHFARMLPTQAGVAVAHGLPFEAAITALTTGAGEILGIPGHGRLEAGAEATFFLCDGDPLQPRNAVRRMWIAGSEADLETRQTRLLQQYQELSELPPSITTPGPRP